MILGSNQPVPIIKMENKETPDSILEFWFGDKESIAGINEDKKALWWSKDKQADAEIRNRFESVCRSLGKWLARKGQTAQT